MNEFKQKIEAIKSKIELAKLNSKFVNKVIETGKQYQASDNFEFWQANNDKAPLNKPWGSGNK
jgi:hypothetical protein